MTRARAAAGLTALLMTVASPAGAARGADPALRAAQEGRALVKSAAASRASQVLSSMLRAGGVRTGRVTRPARLPVAGAPVALARPLGALMGALASAEALRQQALGELSTGDLSVLSHGVPSPQRSTARARISVNGVRLDELGGRADLSSRARAAAARADTTTLALAAITVLRSVEDQAAALRRDPSTRIAAELSRCGITGDMAYESGDCSILVGNTGPNTYPAGIDPALIVDLGGDDVYQGETAVGRGTARAVVDVSGSDRYEHSVTSDVTGLEQQVDASQGVGILGVGVLADLSGDDTYLSAVAAVTPELGLAGAPRTLVTQGSASVGAGVLADFGGADTYTSSMTSTGGEVQAVAQGAGLAGIGGLLDLEASPAAPTDTFDVSAVSLLHKRTATDQFEQYVLDASSVTAQGAGTAGVGVLVDAAGDDAYRALSQGAVASTTAQGGAMIGGGVLVDGGGNDTMTARALGDTTLGLITTDPDVCWRGVVEVRAGSTVATGQGGAGLGAAILVDAGGNDTRTLAADSTAGAIAEVTSNLHCADNTAAAHATSGGAILLGQGAGGVGAGTLVDLGGNDVNDVSAASKATARAIATSPGTDFEVASATVGDAGTEAQGYGFTGLGVLADAAGDDGYASRVSARSSQTTSQGTVTSPGVISQFVQGWGATGAGWLVDLGGTDAYSTDPPGASEGADDSCWSNAPDGRGRDVQPGPLPSTCP